jgi:hypothetical protein
LSIVRVILFIISHSIFYIFFHYHKDKGHSDQSFSED